MGLIGTAVNATLLLLIGGLLSWQMRRFRALESGMDALQRSVDGLRSDLTQVALAVGTRPESGTDRPRRGS